MTNDGMLEAVAPTGRIRRAYDLLSPVYGLMSLLDRRPRLLGLDLVKVQPHDRVLEVAVGPGVTLREILGRVDRNTMVHGVDLSPRMLARARRRVAAAGYTNVVLQEGDARHLPYADGVFDVLYNSYMLDLIPLEDLPIVLREFARVLRPGGRLALVNLSKPTARATSWWETLYATLPDAWVPYLLGGCRPVLIETLARDTGFVDVRRRFVARPIPSEVVTGQKP